MVLKRTDRSEEVRRRIMQAVRGRDTKPEMVVRRLVHEMGYRYRLHRRDLPGSPDLVFGSRRKVIFVHGCFWHQHSDPECKIAHVPKSRRAYWQAKFDRNVARDQRQQAELLKAGWMVLVLWECEIRNDPDRLRKLLRSFLD